MDETKVETVSSQETQNQQTTNQPSTVSSFYNPSFLCEYRKTNDQTQYRKEFLRIFNLDSYDETKIIDLQNLLTDLLNKVPEFNNLFLKASEHAAKIMMAPNMENDVSFGLIIMFSYDYLDMFHECVKEYLVNNETVTVTVQERIDKILNILDE